MPAILGSPHSQAGRAWPILLLALAVAAGAAWWYLAPDTLPDPLRKLLPVSERANPALYKWKDANGRWNVTDVPPTDRPYETLKYAPNTNVLPPAAPAPDKP